MFEKRSLPKVMRMVDMIEQQRHGFIDALEKGPDWNNFHPELKHPPPFVHV